MQDQTPLSVRNCLRFTTWCSFTSWAFSGRRQEIRVALIYQAKTSWDPLHLPSQPEKTLPCDLSRTFSSWLSNAKTPLVMWNKDASLVWTAVWTIFLENSYLGTYIKPLFKKYHCVSFWKPFLTIFCLWPVVFFLNTMELGH